MKGFFIEITNNLLEKKHRKAMGSAVWEFMWCLDKITKIDEEGLGWVYGGKPIKLDEISKETGVHRDNVSRNIGKLQKHGYLAIKHPPYGMIVCVSKAKKRFGKNVKPSFDENVKPNSENVKPNKTVSVDNNNNIATDVADTPFSFQEYIAGMKISKQRHIQIIALYWENTDREYENLLQVRAAINRDSRAASRLAGYDNDRIVDVM